jgi:hypothetical protein
MDVANAFAGLVCLWNFCVHFYPTYEIDKDNFGIQLFDRFNCLPKSGIVKYRPIAAASLLYVTVAVAALMWYFVRNNGHSSFASAYFCCYYEALYAVALIPQLFMFNKDKCVPGLLATFVILVAAGRVCTLTFWYCYPYVHPFTTPANRGIQMSSETVNLLILSDFLYYWVRSKLRGHKDVILGGDCLSSTFV